MNVSIGTLLIMTCLVFSWTKANNVIGDRIAKFSALLHLHDDTGSLLPKIRQLYRDFCGKDLKVSIKAFQDHISDIQYVQIKESNNLGSTVLAPAKANKIDKTPKNYVNKFMEIEFGIRDLVTKMRKLAKLNNMKDIPMYSVGLGPKTTTFVAGKKLNPTESNLDVYKTLITIADCLQVFSDDYVSTKMGMRHPNSVEDNFNNAFF